MIRLALVGLLFAMPGFAEDLGWKIGIGIGEVEPNAKFTADKSELQYSFSRRLSSSWDLELKYFGYENSEYLVGGSHGFEMESWMLSGIYRGCYPHACPFIGAGLSWNQSDQWEVSGCQELVLEEYSGQHLGWQAFLGLDVEITSWLLAYGEVRFLQSPNPGPEPNSLQTNIISIGLRYSF